MSVVIKNMPNAAKWTEERVGDHLNAIYKDSFNVDTIYLGRALVNQGLYPDVWKYWKKKFAKHDNIREIMMQIEAAFEAKLFEGAVRKELSPCVSIFALKSNHKWTDIPEMEEDDKVSHPMIIQLIDELIIVDESDLGGTYKKIGPLVHTKEADKETEWEEVKP